MGLSDMGFSKPTPIQSQAIPVVLEGKDLLASAQTGTGKTAAFALPLLEKLSSNKKAGIRALILAPTRELAVQIDEQFWTIGYHTGVTTASVYGGTDWGAQEQAIRDGVNVLVATPGRLLDHIKVSNVDFSQIEFLVLDEADRMLDMGFIPDVMTIIRRLPKERQTLMFSATLSDKVESLARELTKNPVRINISSFKPAEGVEQHAYKVNDDQKIDLVLHLFDSSTEVASAIIFTATKRGADSLARALRKKGVKVSSMHGDRDQKEREATLGDFKAGRINVIVATDVMARGIDVTGVSHVVNFDVPRDLDDYIHRIGRTARAEKKGTAITLVNRQDFRYFQVISEKMGSRLKVMENPVGGSTESQPEAGKNGSQRRNNSPTKDRAPKTESLEKAVSDKNETPEIKDSGNESDQKQSSRSRPKRRNSRRKPKPVGAEQTDAPKVDVINPPKAQSVKEVRESRDRNDSSRNSNRGRGNGSNERGSGDQRGRTGQRGNRSKQSDKPMDPQKSREKQRQELIQQVSNPFQQNKVDKPEKKSEEKGLFGKILSIFGSKK